MFKYVILVIVILHSSLCYGNNNSDKEYQALIKFYNATKGNNWKINTNWLQTDNICTWYGITCHHNNVNDIDLSSNNLNGTLTSLQDLTQLFNLNLHDNSISDIDNRFSDFSALMSVDLSYNKIKYLSTDFLLNSTQIYGINLHGNQLVMMNENLFSGKPQLHYVDLSSNNLQSFPSIESASLSQLGLSYNSISKIGTLKTSNLFQLYLSHNSLDYLSEDFGEFLGNCDMIDLSHNRLKSLPDKFGTWFHSTPHIYLSNNMLKILPLSFGEINSSGSILLQGNLLTLLPRGIESLRVRYLDVSDNRFTDLPSLHVEYLFARNNLIETLSYETLMGPVFLDLRNNRINSFSYGYDYDDRDGNKNMNENYINYNLITLDLSCNNITKTPQWQGTHFKHLTFLDMSNNKIRGLVWNWFIQAPALQYATFANNDLINFEIIFPGICFPMLKSLNLSDNPLLKFPMANQQSTRNRSDISRHGNWFEECLDIDTLSVSTFLMESNSKLNVYCNRYVSNNRCNKFIGIDASFLFDPIALNYTHCYPR